MKRYFEFIEGTSSKFWETWIDGVAVNTRYGRIGATGQTTTKDAGSEEAAQKLQDKLVREKTAKGYLEKAGVGERKQITQSATHEFTGPTEAEACLAACEALDVVRGDLAYEVVSKETSPRRVVIHASAKPPKPAQPPAQKALPPESVWWPPRFVAWVRDEEYKRYDGRYTRHTYLRLPLEFDDPEELHKTSMRQFHQLQDQGDWYPKFPQYRALAVYGPTTNDEEEEIFLEANPSDIEEFFLVDTSQASCPVLLWTHDVNFTKLERVTGSLADFLADLTETPTRED